jgi:dipeptidyl aminopeptidase/acylaminoacyl peptidase
MRFTVALLLALFSFMAVAAQPVKPFTLQQVLSAPFAESLTAAPAGDLFAWVENGEGRHNLYIGGPHQSARELTHNTADDAQEITQLAWAPNDSAIAYTYGAETGADGSPANPAHLQRPTPVQVVLQPLAPDAKPTIIGDGRAPLFERDGRSVLFLRDGQIWVADLDALKRCVQPGACHAGQARCAEDSGKSCAGQVGAPVHQLVFDRGAASQLALSPDGRLLAFVSRRREANEPSHSFVALYDLRSRALRFLDPSTSNDFAPAFSPDGRQIAWLRAPFTQPREFASNRTSALPWSIQIADVKDGASRTIFAPEADKPGSVLPHLPDSGPELYFVANDAIDFYSEAGGWLHLYEVPTEGAGEIAWLTPGNFETEDAAFSPHRKRIVYSSNEAAGDAQDVDRRHLWEVDRTQADAGPVELTHGAGIEMHPQISAAGTIAALVADAKTPMHPAVVGEDGSMTPLNPGSLPKDYPSAELVTPRQVLFDSSDGLHLHGQIFLPRNEIAAGQKRAAILFVHGGPKRQMMLGYTDMDYYSNAYAMNQYLTSLGFVVLSVNYRCGTGYGLDFRQCEDAGATGGTEYNDVLAAAKYLRSLPEVDPKRIGIWGGSYGGYLTALALARNSDLFAAGVDFHGVHDWNLEDNASDWKQGSFAERDAIAAKARASSPIASVDQWRSPVLLIHGDNDPDVAYAETPVLAEALRARHVPVQELIFPDEVHGFLLHRDWVAAYRAAAQFFERTLKP